MSKSGRRTTHLSFIKNNFSKMIQVSKQKYCSAQLWHVRVLSKVWILLANVCLAPWELWDMLTLKHLSRARKASNFHHVDAENVSDTYLFHGFCGFFFRLTVQFLFAEKCSGQDFQSFWVFSKFPPNRKREDKICKAQKGGGQWLHRSAIWS